MKKLPPVVLAITLAAGSSSSMAQPRDVQTRIPVTIIVTQPEGLPRFGDLKQFVSTLLELQIAQDGFSRVVKAPDEPPCTVAPRDVPGNKRSDFEGSRSYAMVVSLNTTKSKGDGAEVRMDYRLDRLERCQRTELLRHSDSFAESELLENLTLTAEILALGLQDDAVSLPVVELAINVPGSTLDRNPIAQELAARILRTLASSGEVEARLSDSAVGGAADYYVDGRLDLTGSSMFGRFSVRSRSQDPIQLQPIEIRRGNEQTFYEKAASSIANLIDDLRYADAAGLTTRLADSQPDQLRARARDLLCIPAPQPGCVEQPQEAERVLARLIEKTKTAEVYELIGVAQVGSGKPVAAAENFRLALKDTSEPGARARLERSLADALYDGRQDDAAANQYETVAKAADRGRSIAPDSESYVRWARSLRLGKGGAVRAADVLVDGLAQSGMDPLPLQMEFRDLVSGARTGVLIDVYARVENARSPETTPLVEIVRPALARAHLHDAEAALGNQNFEAMDQSLRKAEALADDLSADPGAREAMARLRGLWYRDRPLQTSGRSSEDDYKRAESYLRQALSWEPTSSRARFALATTYAFWPGADAKSGPYPQQALALLRPLTLEHYPTAAAYLVLVNRSLNKNEDTRAILDTAVMSDPSDRSALDGLMDVCTDSLFDFDCAAEAAERLDALEGSSGDMSSQLEVAEIEVLAGRYSKASARLQRVLANSATEDKFRAVALFYQVWLSYSGASTREPASLVQAWRLAVKKSHPLWVFGGARHVLRTKAPFNTTSAEALMAMIEEME